MEKTAMDFWKERLAMLKEIRDDEMAMALRTGEAIEHAQQRIDYYDSCPESW